MSYINEPVPSPTKIAPKMSMSKHPTTERYLHSAKGLPQDPLKIGKAGAKAPNITNCIQNTPKITHDPAMFPFFPKWVGHRALR